MSTSLHFHFLGVSKKLHFKSMKVSANADTVSPDGEFNSKALFLIGKVHIF